MCVNEFLEGICREEKIPDLSQADTSYYQIHKIQPITKRHVLLLDFAITTQKPTEICQVSCKNQSRISARVSDDTSGPIKLWHVSPIRLRHVSLTHLQTPINRSLPKAFKRGLRKKGRKETKDSEVQKLCKNQALKPSRTSTLKSKNTQSKIIQIICLDPKVYGNQAQRSKKHQQTTNRWSSTDSSL